MRDISKIMTASFIAGAALLVSACGGGSNEANNMSDANALGTEVFNTEGTTDMNGSTDMNGMTGGNMGAADMNASMNTGGSDMNASANMSMNSTNSM
jgi:hypothetical protein